MSKVKTLSGIEVDLSEFPTYKPTYPSEMYTTLKCTYMAVYDHTSELVWEQQPSDFEQNSYEVPNFVPSVPGIVIPISESDSLVSIEAPHLGGNIWALNDKAFQDLVENNSEESIQFHIDSITSSLYALKRVEKERKEELSSYENKYKEDMRDYDDRANALAIKRTALEVQKVELVALELELEVKRKEVSNRKAQITKELNKIQSEW